MQIEPDEPRMDALELERLIERMLDLDRRATIGPWAADGEIITCPTSDAIEIRHPRYHSHKYSEEAVLTVELTAVYRTAAPILAEEVRRLQIELSRRNR
jgi:hypothetical protein